MDTILNKYGILVCCVMVFLAGTSFAGPWPAPYKRYTVRPQSNPFCNAGVISFCPTGEPDNIMPEFNPGDAIEIYALKKPVWQFKFGDVLGKLNIMHDALGFKNLNTGMNYTMEWYELFQLMNCTFAHVLKNESIQWCNQGAVCIYPGIKDRLWSENGTLAKIATTTGSVFNSFSDWVLWDNRTGLFYETWTVKDKPDGNTWFQPFDCASWVIRALDKFGRLGVSFNQSVHLNYTKINLYSDQPEYLGTSAEVFDKSANKTMQASATNIVKFYSKFQSQKKWEDLAIEIIEDLYEIFEKNEPFYLYYNDAYWLLNLTSPIAKLTYEESPLPKPGRRIDNKLYFENRFP